MKVALIGAGLMGGRRVKALGDRDELVGVYDPDVAKAHYFPGVPATYSLEELLSLESDAVIVASPHDRLAEGALAALRAGKRVLLEKPCARSAAELAPIVAAARDAHLDAVPGYTLRHYPGIREARETILSGEYGPVRYLRAVYGHGGRPGYGDEWRCNAARGGGELLDQGVHLIDLARWLLGPTTRLAHGTHAVSLWSPDVEDSVFLTLASESGAIAQLHASWTEWRPVFRLEVICHEGGVRVDGLGGAYGNHRALFFRRHGVDREIVWGDAREAALRHEWESFAGVGQAGSIDDALAVLRIADAVRAQ